MLTAFSFFSGDADKLRELLEWIGDLGGCKAHDCVLVADAGVDWKTCADLRTLAATMFRTAALVSNKESVSGWIEGPKSLFVRSWDYAWEHRHPFLMMETDAIPLKQGWLDAIDNEWHKTSNAIAMGHLYRCYQANLPTRMLSGIAVYDPSVKSGKLELPPDKNWDVSFTENLPFDYPAYHTDLIYHLWGEPNNPPTFVEHKTDFTSKQPFLLSDIPAKAVIWHRNKDGTLIKLLRKKMNLPAKPVTTMRVPVASPTRPDRPIINVRRTAALGDVLCATVVGRKLEDMGYDVNFQAGAAAHCVLRRLDPPFRQISEPQGNPHVNLDGAYESDPRRKDKHFAQMFVDTANAQLTRRNILLPNWKNFAPRMVVEDHERNEALLKLKAYPRPWVMICPRSNAWANRTVPDHIWSAAAQKMVGTKFWLGNHGAAPHGIVDLQVRHFDNVIKLLSVADLLVTVDSGPAHVAIALGTPTVVVEQASSPDHHYSNQRDWVKVSPPLHCLDCLQPLCPIGQHSQPPCQNVPPELIADTVNRRLHCLTTEDVSVVIAIYKPEASRLNRCLSAVIGQVQEILVICDLAGMIPRAAMKDPKIKYLRMPEYDVGYGRKANYGARHTNGRWIWLINDDAYAAPDCCQRLLEVLRSDDQIGMVGHELRYPDNRIQHGGTFRARDGVGFGHMDLGQTVSRIKHPLEVENVTGASIMMRRRAFYDADCHCEYYFTYCEDNHLCMTMRQAGWKIYYTPHAKAIHDEHASTSITQGMPQHLNHSLKVFHDSWKWYFDKNKNNPGLGTFD